MARGPCRPRAKGRTLKTTTAATTAERMTSECKRLVELLHLDAVGAMRSEDGRRRVVWWTAPGSPPLPMSLDDILEGRADGWIASPQWGGVVFGRLTAESSVRSVAALTTALDSLTEGADPQPPPSGRLEPEDPALRERTRWAYAIHDGLTQVVTSTILELEWLTDRIASDPSEALKVVDEAKAELRKALGEIRRMLESLAPQASGTQEPLESVVDGVMERWHLPPEWSVEGDLQAVPRSVLDAASSVICESVANAAKHSSSRHVAVRVRASENGMEVRVEDSGRGFQKDGIALNGGHLGLEMMRRRVAEVDGTLDIQSSPGKGTRVVARLPVGQQGEKP